MVYVVKQGTEQRGSKATNSVFIGSRGRSAGGRAAASAEQWWPGWWRTAIPWRSGGGADDEWMSPLVRSPSTQVVHKAIKKTQG